jgi:predicted nucleic acid-binding protein
LGPKRCAPIAALLGVPDFAEHLTRDEARRMALNFAKLLRRRDGRRPPHRLWVAVGLIRTRLRFKVQETSVSIMTGALELKAEHGLSYWDAAIVAAARALCCRELYSEDMTHGREIERVAIIGSSNFWRPGRLGHRSPCFCHTVLAS